MKKASKNKLIQKQKSKNKTKLNQEKTKRQTIKNTD